MTSEKLKARTRQDLARMAKRRRIAGWHSMRKEQLVKALLTLERKKDRGAKNNGRNGASNSNGHSPSNGHPAASRRPATNGNGQSNQHRRTESTALNKMRRHNLASVCCNGSDHPAVQDRLTAESHEPYWIHAHWSLTPHTVARAETALGLEWHQARPVIRVFDITNNDATAGNESFISDVEIHGEVESWYVPVDDSTRTYKLHIGYRAPSGKFYALARSCQVRLPRKPVDSPVRNRAIARKQTNGSTAGKTVHDVHAKKSASFGNGDQEALTFEIDAELIVHGATLPNAKLTLLGEHVPVRKDGTFSVSVPLPEGRQVIPAVAFTSNRRQKRTIVLSVERNTRELEPQKSDEPIP